MLVGVACVEGRKTLVTGESFSNRFLGYDEEKEEFEPEPYFVWIGERVVAVLIVALLHLLAIPVFLLWRVCCKPLVLATCCRCFRSSAAKRDASGKVLFSAFSVRTLRLILLGILVSSVVCVAVGMTSNGILNTALNDVVDDLITNGQELVADVDVAVSRILAQDRTANSGSDVQPAIDAGNDALVKAQDIQDDWDTYRGYYQLVVYGLFLLPLAVYALALLLAYTGLHKCKVLNGCALLLLLLLFVVLVVSAIHVLLWLVFSDLCEEADLYLNDPSQSSTREVFGEILGCVNASDSNAEEAGSGFSSLNKVITDALRDARRDACIAADALCNRVNTACTLGPCTSDNVDAFLQETIVTTSTAGPPPPQSLTFAECATLCADDSERSEASGLANGVVEIGNFTNIKTTNLDPILSCQFVERAVSDLNSNVCTEATPALYLITIMLFITVLIYDGASICLCRAQKRFGNVRPGVDGGDDDDYSEFEYEYEYGEYYEYDSA